MGMGWPEAARADCRPAASASDAKAAEDTKLLRVILPRCYHAGEEKKVINATVLCYVIM